MPLATIEKLPTELLQEIFLHAPEVNLPRASPILALKLQHPLIYLQVCADVFEYPPPQRRFAKVEAEVVQRQAAVFAMRWMTLPLLQIYVIHRSARTPCSTPISSIYDPPNRVTKTPPWLHCGIPTRLLHGPWTADKVAFLDFLLHNLHMRLDRTDRTVAAIASQGKRDAVLERNFEVVHLLAHVRRLGRPPTRDLVRFAVIEGECDRSIVFALMVAAKDWRTSRWEDAELDEWVEREEAKGNPKAAWLRLKLMEIRAGAKSYPQAETGNYELPGDVLQTKKAKRWCL
ncbi:hypothetical protein EJ06DRAFT_532593 [Trichodelitschia bisporula]|uniref:F-box domain-containing protein n=1 Tax=Trichodelitschia bisporula TaxID=703511 RepID=A0A6G1HQN9_9PEZI|nr:hypothetical protein EJ06DRAFT_532593 [Trichodelitschia bisporula]